MNFLKLYSCHVYPLQLRKKKKEKEKSTELLKTVYPWQTLQKEKKKFRNTRFLSDFAKCCLLFDFRLLPLFCLRQFTFDSLLPRSVAEPFKSPIFIWAELAERCFSAVRSYEANFLTLVLGFLLLQDENLAFTTDQSFFCDQRNLPACFSILASVYIFVI